MINQANFDSLIVDLEQLRSAANVHTVNKAIFYLRSFSEGAWFLEDDKARVRDLGILVTNCRKAINTADTTLLRLSMRRLF